MLHAGPEARSVTPPAGPVDRADSATSWLFTAISAGLLAVTMQQCPGNQPSGAPCAATRGSTAFQVQAFTGIISGLISTKNHINSEVSVYPATAIDNSTIHL